MKVLIALDDSAASARAAREAVRLFSPAGAEFLVINVTPLPMPMLWGGYGFGAVTPLVVDPTWYDQSEHTEAELRARADDVGVPATEVESPTGDPVQMIRAAADEHDVDVVVVGSHDKSAMRRIFDPSVAAGIIRATYRPVLVVSGDQPD